MEISSRESVEHKIVHSGDTDSAIRFPGMDTFTVETTGSERLRITSSGNVGIGTTDPSVPFEVVSTGSAVGRGLVVAHMSENNLGPQIFFRKARNTPVAPSAVQSGDTLGRLAWAGHNGTQFRGGVSVAAIAAEGWTDTATGAYLEFKTNPIGSVVTIPRVRINPDGNVGIVSTSPIATSIQNTHGVLFTFRPLRLLLGFKRQTPLKARAPT